MSDTFLSVDAASQLHEVVDLLYKRLDHVKRALDVKVAEDDEFDLGINCRLANELEWINGVLDIIERS